MQTLDGYLTIEIILNFRSVLKPIPKGNSRVATIHVLQKAPTRFFELINLGLSLQFVKSYSGGPLCILC